MTFLQKIINLFHKPAVEAAFNNVAKIIIVAEPIVAKLAKLVPNKTLQEVIEAFATFGIPVCKEISADPTSIGEALFTLATTLVYAEIGEGIALNLVQTAIQIAVTAMKAGA